MDMTAATPDSTPDEVAKPKVTSGGLGAYLLIGAGALIILGVFLPWMSVSAVFVGTISKTGMDPGGDGTIFLIAGVVISVFGIIRTSTQVNSWAQVLVPGAVGLLTGIGAFADLSAVNDRLNQIKSTPMVIAQAGPGLYLILLGVLVTFAGSVITSRASDW
jgi:hypothetical protein